MKRSEMVEYIKSEMVDAAKQAVSSRQKEEIYWQKKAEGLLDMIEGLGMFPPVKTGVISVVENEEDGSITVPVWGWEES
jgi:hypothetical protein